MLLGWPGVELVGITTTADPGGRRASYVAHCLQLVGRDDIPVAAGAEVSLTTLQSAGVVIDDERHWPTTIAPRPSPPGSALDLLDRSIERDATVVAIGSYTNLALLEVARPGRLGRVPVVAMGDGRGHLPTACLPGDRRGTTTCSSTPGRRRFWLPPPPG
jgi:purine nucleosidase